MSQASERGRAFGSNTLPYVMTKGMVVIPERLGFFDNFFIFFPVFYIE